MSDPRMNRQGGPPPNQQNLQRIPSNGMHHGGGPPSGHHPGQQQHQMHGGPPPHHGGYGGPPPQHSPHQHVQHHPGMPPPHHGGHHGQYQHPSHHPRQHDRPPPPGHGGYGRPPPGHIDHRGGPPQHQGHPQHGGRIPPPPGQGGPPPGAGGVPSRGFAGWQQPQRDYDTRRQMIAQIVRLLQQRKPDAPREWLQKLPDMARRLEDKLYRYAQTEEEYKDRSSLKQRLQFIALKMAEHRPQNGQGGPPSHPPGAPGQRGMGSGPPGGHPPRGPGGAPPPQQANSHPPAKGLKGGRKPSASSAAGRGRGMVRSGSGQAKPPGGPQDQMNRPPQQGYPPHYQNHPHGAPPGGYPPGHPGARGPPSHGGQYHQPPGGYPPGHPQHQMSHPPHSGGPPGHHPPQAMGGRPPSQQSQNPQHQQVLRQQQQRLLLLRHASKCPVNAPDVCPKTPHCKQMKELWQHIAKCKDNHCRFAHCVSSRYVLSHYHRCKNPQCEVCRPVKDAIHNQMPSDGHQGGPPTGDIARQPSFGDSGGHIMPPHGGGMPPRGPPQQMPPGSTHPQGGSHHPQMPPHHQPPQAHAGPASSTAPKKPIKRQNSKQAPKKGASAGQPDTANLIHQLKVEREKAEALARAHNQKVRELEEKMKALQQQHSEGNIQPGGAPPPAAGGKNSGKRKPAAKRRPSASASKSGGMKKESLSRQHSVASDSGNARPPPPAAANAAVAAPQQMQQHHQQMAMRPGAPGHGVPPSHPAYNKQPPPHAIQQHPQQAMQPHPQQQQRPFVNSAFSGTISLINTFHRDEIRQHISSLVRFSALIKPSELKQRLFPLLRKQLDQQFAYIFLKPVDPVAMDIPDYFDVIKNPMDLTTIRRRLEGSFYKTMKAFAADMLLVYDNAILYNPETPDGFGVNETAKEYAQTFVNDFNKLLLELKAEENIKRTNKDACRLCGGGQFTFEPAVLYCNGKCNSKIKRNAQYYTTPDNKMFWCVPCYNNYLKDRIPTEDGNEIEKSKLEKKKNAELAEESWVQCNQCNRWFHQICAMFNSRNEESKNSQYYCPMCILRYLDKYRIDRIPESRTNTRGFRAKDLQRTKFSDYIEERLTGRILKERKEQAKSKGLSLGDIPEPGELTVRVVLHKDTEVFPRSNLERLYKEAPYNYPRSFPHKVKCVLMFQNIDGVDVLFFALYTQSYGSDCPAPNQRCVYIAYLDSVFYMEPRFLRTPMYQELLIATLDYEKKRGHTKAFIWACPPLAGDDYILYCHPKDQKTQKAEMLRLWYIRLLEDARKRGIVVSVDNLYDAYMRRLPNPCGIPNFDGDYWPGVTEQYVEELEKEKIDPKSLAPRAKRAISRSKNSNNKKGNSKSKKAKGNKLKKKTKKSKIRSSSRPQSQDDNNDNDDDDEDESNPLWPPPPPAKWLEIPQQDALTAKIGECIKQMKDDFFVVYMHHICAECVAHLDQPDTLFWLPEAYREGMGSLDLSKNKYAPPYALCHTCYMKAYEKEFGKEPELKLPPTIDEVTAKEKAEKAEKAKKDEEEKKAGEKRKVEESGDTTIKNEPEQKKMKEEQKPLSEKNGTTKEENGEKKDSEKMEVDLKPESASEEKKDDEKKDEEEKKAEGDGNESEKKEEKKEETVVEKEDEKQAKADETNKPMEEDPPANGDEEKKGDEGETKSETGAEKGSPKKEESKEGEGDGDEKAEKQAEKEGTEKKEEETEVNGTTTRRSRRQRGRHADGDNEEDGEESGENNDVPPPPPSRGGAAGTGGQERILEPGTIAKPQNPWVQRPCKLDEMVLHRSYVAKETKDDDPLMDNQFFDTRQQFLSLCQGNKYQYDQLRRAKHSSMMVLYHLHNPDEPGFVHSCNLCQQEIKEDSWWKCPVCEDFDVCNSCAAKKQHKHKLEQVHQKSKQKIAMEKNRTANIQRHMQLLIHASGCKLLACPNRDCAKMKALLKHGETCQVRVAGQCRICRRIWVLFQIHARQCRVPFGRCSVPRCADIKEHLRKAQAKMQDRRIRAQTDRMNAERARPAEGATGAVMAPGAVPQQGYGAPPAQPYAHPHGGQQQYQQQPVQYAGHAQQQQRRGGGVGKPARPGKYL